MIYAYKCVDCGNREDRWFHFGKADETIPCPNCENKNQIRDYQAEIKTVHLPPYMKSSYNLDRSDFLPSQKDFEKPGDADGSKGMQHWKDTHELKTNRWV